jgi:hypothetical protein
MKKLLVFLCMTALVLATGGVASANTIASSTMWFEGTLTAQGDGGYIGILYMLDEDAEGIGDNISGYDIYAKNGATAWFGDDPVGDDPPVWTSVTISDHDGWTTWDPDTPDWFQYSLNLYKDGDEYKWAVRNHPGATADHPWYDDYWVGDEKLPKGVPMSGTMDWSSMFATETDTGVYLPGTGTPEIPGGAASKGTTAGAWDMDWSWGSELVPLEFAGFRVGMEDLGGGEYKVSMTPTPIPPAAILFASGLLGLFGIRRFRNRG